MSKLSRQSIIYGIFIIVLMHACTTPGYKIKGKMENGIGQTIELQEIAIRDMISLDSTKVDQKGNFVFTGDMDHPRFFVLKNKDAELITLLVKPQENIAIEIDAENFATSYTLDGSEGSQLILDLNNQLYKTIDRIDSVGKVFKDSINENNVRTIKPRMDSIHEVIIAEHREFLSEFIDNHYYSLASIPAVFQQYAPRRYFLDPQQDFLLYEKVDTALMARYGQMEQVKAFDAFVKRNKRMLREKELNQKILGIGAIAPDISQTTPEGDTLTLSSLQGNVVLLDFWASWCKPCRAENPNLVSNYKKYNEKGFEIYQVSLDRTKNAWIQAIADDKLDWHHVSDLQYWNSGPARLYNVRSIPANYLLDREGKIIAKNLRGDALGAKLAEVFAAGNK